MLWVGMQCALPHAGQVFDVRDFGATGRKTDDARQAIQHAVDACAKAGGGTVYFPPGQYTTGTIHLRSHVSIELEAGATIFAAPDPQAYEFGDTPSKAAVFFGDGLTNLTFLGRGTMDGQAEYDWREDDFEKAFDHKRRMQQLGKSLRRSFPKGFPERQVFPHLLWLGRSRDVHIRGLNFLHSPSWTLAFYACEQVHLDRLYIHTSLEEGVWADGVDLDGCRDVFIANCVIETGDDCVALISSDYWGPARACENVIISQCRLASSSAGVKFSEGNRQGVRRVHIHDTLMTPVNRGVVLLTALGGSIEDVQLDDVFIECRRRDWFWAGDGQPFFFKSSRVSELTRQPPKPGEASPGAIRGVRIRNVVARAKGTSPIHGHPENWLEDVTIENLQLTMSHDPSAPFESATHAIEFRWAKNLRLDGVQIAWEPPAWQEWRSALHFQAVENLLLQDFTGRSARPDVPVIGFQQVTNALVRHSRALDGTGAFLHLAGPANRRIALHGNDLRATRRVVQGGGDSMPKSVTLEGNLLPAGE